jgi:tRNA A-37 threonylcarbamoyl transferase component Bud32
MKLSPFKTFRKTTNSLYVLVDCDRKYLVKHYRGPRNFARCRQEELKLKLWKQSGLNVPDIHDKEVSGIREPYLVMSFIEGPSLREYLCKNECSIEEKLETLKKLFYELAQRHDLAIRTDDRNLVHHDPSSGNIMCTEKGFYFIDFETIPKRRHSVPESAGIEVATTCRWIARDIGIGHLHEVLKCMLGAYKGQNHLLNLIVKRTSGRSFQFYHRRQDRKRKRERPQDITKYDIADALAKLL